MKIIKLVISAFFIFLAITCVTLRRTTTIKIPEGIDYEVDRLGCKGSNERNRRWREAGKIKDIGNRLSVYEEIIDDFPEDCMIDYVFIRAYKCAVELGDVDRSVSFAKKIFDDFYGVQIMNDSMLYGRPSRIFHDQVVNHLNDNKDKFDPVEYKELIENLKMLENKGYNDWLEETKFLIKIVSMKNKNYIFLLNTMKYKNGIVELVKRGEINLEN